MADVCEPLKDKILLRDRLDSLSEGAKCLIIFWHGLGDLMMFLEPYMALQEDYGHIEFTLGVPVGLGYEQIVPESVPLTGEQVNETTHELPYDLVAKITFPMNEHQTEHTKGEFCCIHELGIDPVWGHAAPPAYETPLIAVHYQITCLPDSANPDEKTAELVWNDILEAGCVPLECHFQHAFHNPVNSKFSFIDATVRRARAEVRSLVGLLQKSRAFVGVVSGPFHVALSVLPPDRILLLEKDFKAGSFTKLPIATADLRDYKNEVKSWLDAMSV